MRTVSNKLASCLLAGVLAVTSMTLPVTAGASDYMTDRSEPSGGTMLADAFLMRPFMLASTIFTTATFIVTLPFSALGGNVGEAADQLVLKPGAYTFTRPLGEL